ncbi:MAG TPA: hypothetical protein PKJ32_01120 [Piscinibacter sp.]|nr:hypothetical protein [Piscinibacter sp.]
MDYSTGKLAFIFIVATLLATVFALLLARRYRHTMRTLMSAPAAAPPPGADVRLAAVGAPARIGVADNRRAGWRVTAMLVMMSALISFSSAWLFLSVAMARENVFTPARLIVLGLLNLWPVIPALGLLWRWSRTRLLAALALWFVASLALMAWRSIEAQPLSTMLLYLAGEIGAPMLFIAALCLGGATRAIAPWLLPLTLVLVWASIAGVDLLAWIVQARSDWLKAMPGWLNAYVVMLGFVVAPWLIAWWPARQLGRWLGAAYTRKWLSELIVLFTAVWGIVLLMRALGAGGDMGLAGAVMLLPLAWVPATMAIAGRQPTPPGRPPTLLVLRVFQRDAQVQALFDDVVERWRLTGNTVLIAGTDLVERTIDASDIFSFIDGRLGERFIRHPAEVNARVAGFDLQRDADGRHRINEVYCHDSTWQQALDALVAGSDVVLMDLRSFKTHNRGCRHELGVLARAPRLGRVVVLTDGDTDRGEAAAATAGAPPGRFVWIDSARVNAAKRREVLAALFVADTAATSLNPEHR